MPALHPKSPEHIVDQQGRPYFLWDMDMTLVDFLIALRRDPAVRPMLLAKMLREARPDDALQFVGLQELADEMPALAPFLGRHRDMWVWLVGEWRRQGHVH